jgi:hypothetical protein
MDRLARCMREAETTDNWFTLCNRAIELYMKGKSKRCPQVLFPERAVLVCSEDDAVLMSFPDDMLVFKLGDETVETFGRDGEELFLALPPKRE